MIFGFLIIKQFDIVLFIYLTMYIPVSTQFHNDKVNLAHLAYLEC